MRLDALTTSPAAPAPEPAAKGRAAGAEDARLRSVAQEFETVFVAEMLKQAKIGEAGGLFAGGPGEEAFRSFLIEEYAERLTDAHDFGLAAAVYRALEGSAENAR